MGRAERTTLRERAATSMQGQGRDTFMLIEQTAVGGRIGIRRHEVHAHRSC